MKYLIILSSLLILSSCESFNSVEFSNCNNCSYYEIPETDLPPLNLEPIVFCEEMDINDYAEINGIKYFIEGYSDIWKESSNGNKQQIYIPKPSLSVGTPRFIRMEEYLLFNENRRVYLLDGENYEKIYEGNLRFIHSIGKHRFLFTTSDSPNIIYEYDLEKMTYSEFYEYNSDQENSYFTKGVQTSDGLLYITFYNNSTELELLVLNGNNLVRKSVLNEFSTGAAYCERLFLVNDKVLLVGFDDNSSTAYAMDVTKDPILLFRRKSGEVLPDFKIRYWFKNLKDVIEYDGKYYFVGKRMIAGYDPQNELFEIVWNKKLGVIKNYITVNGQVYASNFHNEWNKINWWD